MVRGASDLAKKNKVSELTIGLTIVAFGTSAPELVVNTVAALKGHSDIVLGNVIGSNIFNLFLIMGVVGVIYPIKVRAVTVFREIPISLGALLVFWLLATTHLGEQKEQISQLDSAILLALFGAFLWYVFKQMQKNSGTARAEKLATAVKAGNLQLAGLIVLGLAGLIGGGKLVVDNAVVIASLLGVSQKMIALTIVAAGTSLPELVTSIVAAMQKKSDLAVGNIIGSNIFNLLMVLPLGGLIKPLDFNPAFNADIFLLLVGTVLLFIAMFTGRRRKLDRWESGIFVVGFIGYTLYLIAQEYPGML